MIIRNNSSLMFMSTTLLAKIGAAISQLYSIWVISKIHDVDSVAVIFLLFGYSVWVQIFEFGFAQTIQNRFNARAHTPNQICLFVILHFFFLSIISLLIIFSQTNLYFLMPESRFDADKISAFSFGIALMILAANNTVLLRLLLVINKGTIGNVVLFAQSVFFIAVLTIYQWIGHIDLRITVILCFVTQIFVFLPIIGSLILRVGKRSPWKNLDVWHFLSDAKTYWLISLMALFFVGSDYYVAAHFLDEEDIVSYHFSTRCFFISFSAYFAFVQHKARHFTIGKLASHRWGLSPTILSSLGIGFLSTVLVYGIVCIADQLGLITSLINADSFDFQLINFAFLYFIVRVPRDIGLLIIWNLGAKTKLAEIYLLEAMLGFGLLFFLFEPSEAKNIFVCMSLGCGVSMVLTFLYLAQISTQKGA